MSAPTTDATWMQGANCLGYPAEIVDDLFFPLGPVIPAATKRICGACTVRDECKAYGEGQIGIWGGERTTERDMKGNPDGLTGSADIAFFLEIGMSHKWIEQKLGLHPQTLRNRRIEGKAS